MGGGTTKFNLTEYLNFNPNLENKKIVWREFRVGDIFDIKCSKYHDPKHYNSGEIPYIARTTFDNGVIKYVATNENLYEANCIIIGAESARAFYQEKPFITGNKIYRLYLKDKFGVKFNKNLALFFCSLINIAGEKYTYTNAFVSNKVESEFVKLPIYENGKIAFDFMENYILNLKNQANKFIQSSKKL